MSFKCVKKFEGNYDKYIILATLEDKEMPEFLSENVRKQINLIAENKKFEAKAGNKLELALIDDGKVVNVVVIGLGEKNKLNPRSIRENIYKGLKGENGNALITFIDKELDNADIIAEVVEHVNYTFDKYKSEKKEKFLEVAYLTGKKVSKVIEGYELGKISSIVKDLVNEQADIMTPKVLSEQAAKLGQEYGFEVEILDEKKAEKLGMKAYLSVARAAHNRPYVIVMRYKGNEKSNYTYGLVGKGLTYDTGGLSLKPTDSMANMKDDMGGAATVIGAMCAIAKMKVKKNVTCVIAACENSIGPNAYRPGDIVETMNGKTIEVLNTDAEGRLTLADAITYIIRKENVDEVIDAATLTGAMLVALGEDVTGVFTNDDAMAHKLIEASENWNEYFWQMPMFPFFRENIKSKIADIKNSGVRWGGSINAAKFLEEFVEDKKWIHLDIAGTAFSSGNNSYYPKGATGQVFRTLYSYIKNN